MNATWRLLITPDPAILVREIDSDDDFFRLMHTLTARHVRICRAG